MLDSPFAHRLETNYVPTDSELEEIMNFLVDPQLELARMEAQAIKMQSLLDELTAKCDSLKHWIGAHKALTSAARRIPEDVVREIFALCLPSQQIAVVDAGQAPLLLTHICGYWRRIAHSMPNLWSSIHIPGQNLLLSGCSEARISDFSKIVQTWLDRSHSDLSVSMSLGGASKELQKPLNTISNRLRRLEVSLDPRDKFLFLDGFLNQGAQDLPRLECLKIDSMHDFGPTFWIGKKILQLPTLRRVSLRFRVNPLQLPLPWDELLELDLSMHFTSSGNGTANIWVGGLSSYGAVDVLQRCPRLRKCTLHITRKSPFEPRPMTTVPDLEVLSVEDAINVSMFLNSLVLPRLRHLSITQKLGWEEENKSAILLALESHTGCLTSVNFGVNLFSGETLLAFLLRCPSLLRLTLHSSTQASLSSASTYQILDNAILANLTGGLCPLLAHVEFVKCAVFSDSKLLDFAATRMRSPHPLQSLTVEFGRPLYRDIRPHLAPYVAAGLKLQLKYTEADIWKYNPCAGQCRLSKADGIFL